MDKEPGFYNKVSVVGSDIAMESASGVWTLSRRQNLTDKSVLSPVSVHPSFSKLFFPSPLRLYDA